MTSTLPETPLECENADAFAPVARQRLGEDVWRYLQVEYARGATGQRNEEAWDRLRLVPRIPMAGGVAEPVLASHLLGADVAAPLIVAPTGRATRFHRDGELATLRAAASRNLLVALPSSIVHALEPLHAACPGANWWQQLYCSDDRAHLLDICQTGRGLGCRAIVLTVDLREAADTSHLPLIKLAPWEAGLKRSPVPVRLRSGFDDIEWLAGAAGLPLIVKGVMHPRDIVRCVDLGVQGIIVSNHGGMLCDTVATAEVLGDCVAAASGRIPIFVDGGIRNGRSLLKAQALGASGCLVGRAFSTSLAAFGEQGVARLMDIMIRELRQALIDVGRNELGEVGRDEIHLSTLQSG